MASPDSSHLIEEIKKRQHKEGIKRKKNKKEVQQAGRGKRKEKWHFFFF